MYQQNKSAGFSQIILLIILAIGFIVGYYLVNFTTTNTRPEAFEPNAIKSQNDLESPNNQYLVDVFIDPNFSDQQQAVDWAEDTIENYINNKFKDAGVIKRLKVNQITTSYDNNDCLKITPRDNPNCTINKGNISLYLLKNQTNADGLALAYSDEGALRQNIPSLPSYNSTPFSDLDQAVILHEMGHMFKLPDYIVEDVLPENNEVVPIGITAHVKDIMYKWSIFDPATRYFSPVSREFINQTSTIPIGYGETMNWLFRYIPQQINLFISDEQGISLPGVKVEIFRSTWTKETNGFASKIINAPIWESISDAEGLIHLGDSHAYFIYDAEGFHESIFLRLTYNGEKRYAAVTNSYLNEQYFLGDRDQTTIHLSFPLLVDETTGSFKSLSNNNELIKTSNLSPLDQKILDQHLIRNIQLEDKVFFNQ